MQSGYFESFNGRMPDELLNESLFLDQARQFVAAWIADYDTTKVAFLARLQDAGSLYRSPHRNRPSRRDT
jgi:hypothetical protein